MRPSATGVSETLEIQRGDAIAILERSRAQRLSTCRIKSACQQHDLEHLTHRCLGQEQLQALKKVCPLHDIGGGLQPALRMIEDTGPEKKMGLGDEPVKHESLITCGLGHCSEINMGRQILLARMGQQLLLIIDAQMPTMRTETSGGTSRMVMLRPTMTVINQQNRPAIGRRRKTGDPGRHPRTHLTAITR